MPLLRINATQQGYDLHDSPQSARRRVRHATRGTGPVIIMVHGYKYEPGHAQHCPHQSLFASDRSWPEIIMRCGDHTRGTLCIAFGWNARGGLRLVHQRAHRAARSLAELIQALKASAPHRPVHIIAHSMGSEVALTALKDLPEHSLQRMILLTGASHRDHAIGMLRTPAGQSLELLNVTSRENDLFDLAFERMIPGSGAIGRGLEAPNALTLQLDCRVSLRNLSLSGFPIEQPDHRISHWSIYTRPGAMAFYARALHDPQAVPFEKLRGLLPDAPEPHYARLWPSVLEMPVKVRSAPISLAHRLKTRIMGAVVARRPHDEHAY